jgi:hypothetical protein
MFNQKKVEALHTDVEHLLHYLESATNVLQVANDIIERFDEHPGTVREIQDCISQFREVINAHRP